MELNEFVKRLFDAAKEAGFEACECYYTSGENMEISVFSGEIDDYSLSSQLGLCFRGLYNGRMGYASTHVIDDEAVNWLVDSAKSSAELVDNDDKEFLFGGSEKYAEIDAYDIALENMGAREKIDLALSIEKKALSADERIKRVQDCGLASESAETRIVNTLGLDVSFRENLVGAFLSPIAEADGDTATGSAMRFGRNASVIDADAMVKDASKEAVGLLGATPCASGSYKVLLNKQVMTSILSTFTGMFSAENAQHGLSLLKDREGEKIAADIVTIMDDPLLKNGLASAPFDCEGVATYTKAIVENGVLKTLMHNLKTAHKQGVETTGNASKPSLGGSVSVAPSNFFIKAGTSTFDELVEHTGDGVLITGIMGMHSGANGISGDFSLGAHGYMIEGGRLGRPVKGITIAGNYLKLLGDIVEIGSDLWFGAPGGSCCGAPSVIVSSLSVAGQ